MKLKHRSHSVPRGKFALFNASSWAVRPLCEHEVVSEIGKVVVVNGNDWVFSTSVVARIDLQSLAYYDINDVLLLQEGVH